MPNSILEPAEPGRATTFYRLVDAINLDRAAGAARDAADGNAATPRARFSGSDTADAPTERSRLDDGIFVRHNMIGIAVERFGTQYGIGQMVEFDGVAVIACDWNLM